MNLIKLALSIILITLLISCSYHSNIYPPELKNPKILTEKFLEGSDTISVRNDKIDFPNWSIRFFGKQVIPKLNKEQEIYMRELERLRIIRKQQLKIEKLKVNNEAKLKKLEKRIYEINNFPKHVDGMSTSWGFCMYTHKYKKVGYEYIYNEKNLFWGLIKWGKRRK